jgi:histidine triad (HIT) family protein
MKTFEDILRGETRVARVFEDERFLAFLAPKPQRPGHVVLCTKTVHPYLFGMQPEEYAALWERARLLAQQMEANLPCERVCVAVVGWEVRHVHIHLVPTDAGGQFPPLGGPAASHEELEWIAYRIRTGRSPAC